VAEFVEKGEPKVIETVISKCECDHRKSSRVPQSGAIKMGARQMFLDH